MDIADGHLDGSLLRHYSGGSLIVTWAASQSLVTGRAIFNSPLAIVAVSHCDIKRFSLFKLLSTQGKRLLLLWAVVLWTRSFAKLAAENVR